jgi:hypothetical protein
VYPPQRHFYAAFAYIKQYPIYSRMPVVLDMDPHMFSGIVVPTVFSLAEAIAFLEFNTRLWDCNHTEHFLERTTTTVDGFPLTVCKSQNRFVQTLCYSGK